MNNTKIFVALTILIVGSLAWYSFGRRESGTFFDTQPSAALPAATTGEIIDLQNGQTFDLAITPVTKLIAQRSVKMLGYNGAIPGPTLRVPEGAEVTIDRKNGGTIGTSLHAHGVRMENAFDGV